MKNNIANFVLQSFASIILCSLLLSTDSFAETETYEEPVVLMLEQYHNSLIDEATFSSSLYQVLHDNPDYSVDRTIKDTILESEISDFFAEFLVDKELAGLSTRGTLVESPSVLPVAAKLFPPVSPLIHKIKKINETHQKLESCTEISNYFECISSVLLDVSELPYLTGLFQVKIKEHGKDLIPSFDEELFYALVHHVIFLSIGDNFCYSYFAPEEYSFVMFNVPSAQTAIKKVAAFIEKVPSCYVPILSALRSRTSYAIEHANALEADNGIRYLEVLENSHDELKGIKTSIILSPSGDLRHLARKNMTGDIFSSLEFRDKIGLIVTGRLPEKFYILVLVSSFFLLGFFFLSMRVYNSIETVEKGNPEIPPAKKKAKETKKVKRSNSSMNLETSDQMDEYTSLLLVFGLTDEASDADIKKAYRDVIKRLHPDSGLPVDQDKLEEIQNAHERLMELRRGWFGLSR
jgi:hypothetical protein